MNINHAMRKMRRHEEDDEERDFGAQDECGFSFDCAEVRQ